jgi:ABC-type nitrate/sulfonate/bicarbonate transport system permease component
VSTGELVDSEPGTTVAIPLGGPGIVLGSPLDLDGDDTGARATASRLLARPGVATVVGLCLLLVAWWVVAILSDGNDTLATPPAVLRAAWDFRSVLWTQSGTTLSEAAVGFVGGNALGMVLAVAFVQFRAAEKGVLQLAIVTHCLPVVAIGPLLELLLTGREPRYVMSALLVFFPTVVTVQVGLRRTDRVALEVVRVSGGGRWAQFRYVRLMTAVPYILTALKMTAPLALLGAILGEFLGGSGGLGILIITSQQAGLIARTWGIALTCTLWSMLAFLTFSLLTRVLAPWAPRSARPR